MTKADAWEPIVKAMIDDEARYTNRKRTKVMLRLFANMIERGSLPPSGSAYVAKVLRKVASEDFVSILPKPTKPAQPQPAQVFAAVTRERHRAGDIGMEEIYRRVARRLNTAKEWSAGTVKTRASEGKALVRSKMDEFIASGGDRSEAIEMLADALNLSPAHLSAEFPAM